MSIAAPLIETPVPVTVAGARPFPTAVADEYLVKESEYWILTLRVNGLESGRYIQNAHVNSAPIGRLGGGDEQDEIADRLAQRHVGGPSVGGSGKMDDVVVEGSPSTFGTGDPSS